MCYYAYMKSEMKFEILADFDGTLTLREKGHGNSFSVLRDVMSEEGQKYSDDIYAKYSPKEYDFSISATERDALMREWWVEEFDGITRYQVHKDDIKKAAASDTLMLRPYVRELFALAKENNIPILILTAGVADIIIYKLAREGLIDVDNEGNIKNESIQIIGNRFTYDEDGYVSGTLAPLVYIMNKYDIMKSLDKKIHADTAFVLGDHPADVSMCDPTNHKQVIRFGFLNDKVNNGDYDVYDYLYEKGDASMEHVFTVIQEEIGKVIKK